MFARQSGFVVLGILIWIPMGIPSCGFPAVSTVVVSCVITSDVHVCDVEKRDESALHTTARTLRERQVRAASEYLHESSPMLDSDTPAGDHDGEKAQYAWNAGRLVALGREVCIDFASMLASDDWRPQFLDNELGQLPGEEGSAAVQIVLSTRYNIGEHSSAGSPERVSPGDTSPTLTMALPLADQQYLIATPDRPMPAAFAPAWELVRSHGSGASVPGRVTLVAVKQSMALLATQADRLGTILDVNKTAQLDVQALVADQYMQMRKMQQHMLSRGGRRKQKTEYRIQFSRAAELVSDARDAIVDHTQEDRSGHKIRFDRADQRLA